MNVTSASQLRCSLALAAVFAVAFAASGCETRKTVDGQLGELGRIEFTYTRSCFFGCLVDQPLLVGTRETMRLEGEAGSAPKLSVRSTNDSVADFGLERQCFCEREGTTGRIDVALDGMCEEPWQLICENTVQVGALEAGEAKVEVLSENDSVIDRVAVHVKEADRARFFATLPDEVGEQAGDSFSLAAESRLELRLELYDEDGIELLAPEGVTWRVTDPGAATLDAFLVGSGEEVIAGRDIVVETLTAGETSVEIDVPGLTAAIDIEITD
jgi:hypothetical protein